MIKVLIIEDDPMVQEITESYINDINGYSVEGKCTNGSKALDFLEKKNVELVIADINMPEMDGITFIKNLRSRQIKSDVIFITGLKDTETIKTALEYGAVDYIIKPYDYNRFSTTMESYRKRFQTLKYKNDISQSEIDTLLNNPISEISLPKGLHPTTLDKILSFINSCETDFSVDDVSNSLNMSKVSVRHYLEYLCKKNRIICDTEYGTVGRPKYTYRKKLKTF